jgi:hypothetical protein
MTRINLSHSLDYLGFDAATRAVLSRYRDYVLDLLPAVIDDFYLHVGDFPDIARHFDLLPSLDHGKQLQFGHWRRLLSLDFDEAYIQAAERIGHAHFRLGIQARDHIGAYGYLQSVLTRAIARTFTLRFADSPCDEALDLTRALNLLVSLDVQVTLGAYVEDGASIYL